MSELRCMVGVEIVSVVRLFGPDGKIIGLFPIPDVEVVCICHECGRSFLMADSEAAVWAMKEHRPHKTSCPHCDGVLLSSKIWSVSEKRFLEKYGDLHSYMKRTWTEKALRYDTIDDLIRATLPPLSGVP